MITPEIFQQALDTNRQIIECIFQQEDSFKEEVLSVFLRLTEHYTIHRVHVSGYRFRIALQFDDMKEKDVVIDAQDVYHWYAQEYKRLRGV
jgi:mRNA-degrading endonuclease RelE of RelBE toxin-antitoxin system